MKTRLTTGGIDWHAYQPYRTLKRRIISAKKSLIREIEATIDPFMHETGFCKGRLDRSKTEYHWGFFFTFSDKQERERIRTITKSETYKLWDLCAEDSLLQICIWVRSPGR